MSTLTVNTINETTSGNGVTVDGVNLKDSQVPAAAGSSMVLLEKFTASNTASKIFNLNSFTSFNIHRFVFQHLLPATDNVSMYMLLGTDSSTFANGSNDYRTGTMFQYIDSNNDSGRTSEVSGSQAVYLPYVGNDGNRGVCGIFDLYGATDGNKCTYVNHRFTMHQLNNYMQAHTGGSYKVANTDDAFVKWHFGSGNIASGTITLYGIKDA
jgi:hypothetical protein